MRDEDLQAARDYSEGQREAAHRVLVEIVNLLSSFRDDMRIIGGWVPDLMFPNKEHIGSVDVDVLLNHIHLKESGYMNIERILLQNGYRKHPDKYFAYAKDIHIGGISYMVDLDILAGKYNGTEDNRRSQRFQGIRALKASGGNFAFDFPAKMITITAKRPDGSMDVASVGVVAVVPYLVMKTIALGRGKPKDAYDIYFTVKNYPGGIDALASEFRVVSGKELVMEMVQKLKGKFASVNHAGPVDVADFLGEADEEIYAFHKRDAYEQIDQLLEKISEA